MFDTMTLTKAAGALFTAWLVLLLGKWGAEGLYHVGGHGEQAYVIEVAESEGAAEEAEPGVPFEEVFASADPADGEGLFRACQACHKLDGTGGVGPHLNGVVGRDKGGVSGYSYSDVLASMEGDWSPENLSAFLENPKAYAPGTKMAYAGMRDIEDRANLIAYLAETEG